MPYRRPYVSENFLTVFSLGLGHDSLKFSDRYLAKKFGEKFPPGGSDPKIFYKRIDSSTRAMCLHNFIAISKKLWPVGRDKVRADKKKQKDKLVDFPSKPEAQWRPSIYRLIELGAHNFSPETFPLQHFRFLHDSSKTVDFVEIWDRIKI